MSRTVKVAVIGTGLAGLTAAYLLARPSRMDTDVVFQVHVFEKSSTLGMDSSSISRPIPGTKKDWRIDVPMRSFQGGYYPQLIAMYKHLGVTFRQRDFSYSFSMLFPSAKQQDRRMVTTMIYNGNSGLGGVSMPSTIMNDVFADYGHKGLGYRLVTRTITLLLFSLFAIQLLCNYLRLLYLALPFRRPEYIRNMTFREWAEYTVPKGFLARQTGWDLAWWDFTWNVLVPLFSAVCTTTEEDVLEHPIEELLDYIWLTLGTHHYVVVNGTRDVVLRLTASIQHIHLSSCITSIRQDDDNPHMVSIDCQTSTSTTAHTGFHHVIFATQANRAVPLLESYLSSLPPAAAQREAINAQIECLRAFRYRSTIVVNHTDNSLMPENPQDRRELNLINFGKPSSSTRTNGVEANSKVLLPCCVSETHTMATHVLPVPTGYPPTLPRLYQTTNPIVAPRQESIVSVAVLERAVLTLEAKQSLKGLHEEEEEARRRWWQSRVECGVRLGRLQGAGKLDIGSGERMGKADVPGIWICGAFAYGGIPLLEGCVVSARTVVEQGLLASEGVAVNGPPW